MILDLIDEDGAVTTCSIDEFVACNEGLDDEEIDQIAALDVGETYASGGGAGVLWSVRRTG